MKKHVLVRWKIRAAAGGQMRYPGDEDVMPHGKAKFLSASGMVNIVGTDDKVIPRLMLCEEGP